MTRAETAGDTERVLGEEAEACELRERARMLSEEREAQGCGFGGGCTEHMEDTERRQRIRLGSVPKHGSGGAGAQACLKFCGIVHP